MTFPNCIKTQRTKTWGLCDKCINCSWNFPLLVSINKTALLVSCTWCFQKYQLVSRSTENSPSFVVQHVSFYHSLLKINFIRSNWCKTMNFHILCPAKYLPLLWGTFKNLSFLNCSKWAASIKHPLWSSNFNRERSQKCW